MTENTTQVAADRPAAPPAAVAPLATPAALHGPPLPYRNSMDSTFGSLWPEPFGEQPFRSPRVVATAIGLALLGALLLPQHSVGLGLVLIMLGALIMIVRQIKRPLSPGTWSSLALVTALLIIPVVRDSAWLAALSIMTAIGVLVVQLTRATSISGMLLAAVALPLSWLRGLPWLGRSLSRPRRLSGAAVRTVVLSLILVLIFGALFASGDAIFGSWVSHLLPTVDDDLIGVRIVLFGLLFAVIAGLSYLAAVPMKAECYANQPHRPIRIFEWAAPVSAVIVTFGVFLVAQLTALFGGHAYVQRTTGLTYAEHVHAGFGQLVVATMIVVGVVAVVLHRVPRSDPEHRRLVRVLLGTLCSFAVVVVASALTRLAVYEQAYGFTELRLVVAVFEIWLGIMLLLLGTAGVWLRARWVPKVAVWLGAGMILVLALANPAALVAQHNVDRFAETGKIDVDYLSSLSVDAVGVLDKLPAPLRDCTLGEGSDEGPRVEPSEGLIGWNFGRQRAAAILAERPASESTVRCPS